MLHHIHTVSGLLAAALLLSAPVQAALPAYSAVKDEAKTVNKYMIVVWAVSYTHLTLPTKLEV